MKDLMDDQLVELAKELEQMGCFVYATHKEPIEILTKIGVDIVYGQKTRQWMSLVNATDYIISVDTATFHLAGGLKKPLTGIFTFADGKVYGKYYDFVLVQKHRDDGDWDCGPCYTWYSCPKTGEFLKPCLTKLTIELIMDGIRRMFKRWPIKY
jgi:ADP-heptose:LPS heptosyltransferase